MKVLITAATGMELASLKERLTDYPKLSIQFAVTGVGAVSTVYHLMKLLKIEQFELMLQVGIAGSFDHGLSLGTAVNIEKEVLAEMGVQENNEYRDIFSLNLADRNERPFSDGVLFNPYQHLLSTTGLINTTAVTNNSISTDEMIIDRYKNKYMASIESMEGAAFHYVGIMESIPFIQIRGISNYVGERNKQHWKIKEALHATTEACQHLLDQL
jgi:futalosine hydrolase